MFWPDNCVMDSQILNETIRIKRIQKEVGLIENIIKLRSGTSKRSCVKVYVYGIYGNQEGFFYSARYSVS
jgi:hypothetical protein